MFICIREADTFRNLLGICNNKIVKTLQGLECFPYGSITYDRKRGDMLIWDNEDEFLVWLAAEETKNTIKLKSY